MTFASTRALVRYIIAAPIASFWSSPIDGHGDVPYHARLVWLAPMWKCTGNPRSAQTSQSGSHAGSPRSGRPCSCGSLEMLTPRNPRRGDPFGFADGRVDVPRRAAAPSGTAGRRTRPGSRPWRRCRASRTAAGASGSAIGGELLAAEAGDVRVDDLGPDADLVHHREARRDVVGRGVGVVEHPPMKSLPRHRSPSRRTTLDALARLSATPSTVHVGSPSTSTHVGAPGPRSPSAPGPSRDRGARCSGCRRR